MELKEITNALYDWAEKSEKRNVLCIATEVTDETEEGYNSATSTAINGKKIYIVDALVDMMQEDKKLADLIKSAFVKYTVDNTDPIVGVVSIKTGKEADNE